jgi:hypothetical protein
VINTEQRTKAAVVLALLALAACGGSSLPCSGPPDCGGNACCLTIPDLSGSTTLVCTSSPSACAPVRGLDQVTRLCHTDADCTAGGISTSETRCCHASVMSQPAMTCTYPSHCH